MIKTLVFGFFLFLTLGSQPAIAGQTTTVSDMIAKCKAPGGHIDVSHCIGAAEGVATLMMMNAKVPDAWRMCAKSFVSNGQVIQIFLNWAEKNPVKWQLPSGVGFALALAEAYPCG
jgi:hypothetical protein